MNKLNLLSRAEMKKVMGGEGSTEDSIAGTCAWHSGDMAVCGMTKDEAQAMQAYAGGNWCCDSCPKTIVCP